MPSVSTRALFASFLAAWLTMAGCASQPQDGGREPAAVSPGEDLCVRLLRDMRLYCQESTRNPRAPMSVECISRRLEVERACF